MADDNISTLSFSDYIQGFPAAPVDLPKPPEPQPVSLLDEFRQQFPQNKISDDDLLKQMRAYKAPYLDQKRFNALASDPYGRAGIEEEARKPPTGLQFLREKVPAAANQSDNELLARVYDQAKEGGHLNPQIVSLADFKDLMNPQADAMHMTWQLWKSMAAGASAAGHQISGEVYGLINSPQAWRAGFAQALDQIDPTLKAGTTLKTFGDQAAAWWMGKINDASQEIQPSVPGVDPVLTPKGYGDLFRQFTAWVAGKGQEQQRAAQVDQARKEQAQGLAQVTGGPVGGFLAKGTGVIGEQGTQMGIGLLMSAFPGAELTSAAALAAAIQGNLSMTNAWQNHSDHILLEGFQGGGLGYANRYMWDSPNGRLLTGFTTLLADPNSEETVKKWLRGEKVDWQDVFWGTTLDVTGGVLSGMHANARAKATVSYKSPKDLFYDPKEGRPVTSEMLFAGAQPELEAPWPISPVVTRTVPKPEPTEPTETAAPQPSLATTDWLHKETFAERVAREQLAAWDAAGEEFSKAVQARENGNYPKAVYFMDHALAALPVDVRREAAQGIVQYTKDATAPVQPIQEVKTPQVPPDPAQQRINDIVNNGMFGLSPKRGEAGAMANPFGGRQYRWTFEKGLEPIEEQPPAPEVTVPETIPSKIQDAYHKILPTQLGSAVKISELARESGMSVAETKKVVGDLAAKGDATLDEGHWPTATEEERAAAITQRGTPRLLVRFPRLADRGQAGFTINWINEMANWVREHWPTEERPWATAAWLRTFEPQHPSRGPEAVSMWTASKMRTAEAQQKIAAIPVEVARALEIDKVLRGGEKVAKREEVFDRLSDAQKKEILIQAEEGLVHTGNTQVDWLMNSFYRPFFKAINENERSANFAYDARNNYFFHALPRDQQERYVQWYDNYMTSDPRWTQKRQLPTYRVLFEAGFTPVTLNPERLFQMRLASSFQAIRKVSTLRDSAQPGWGAIAKNRRDPVTGQYVDILTPEEKARYANDPAYMSQRAPNGEDYFITKNAFAVIKNAWEPSTLYTDHWFSPAVKALATAKGIGSRGLLAWSIAHLQHVGVIYPASALVRLERNLLGPNRRAAFYQSLNDMMKNPETTMRLMNDWRGIRQKLSPEERDANNDLKQMGLKFSISEEQQMGFSRWLAEQFPRIRNAQASVMGAKLVDLGYKLLTSEPLQRFQFEHAIPFMKMSAALQAREALFQARPELLKPGHELERATALAKVGDTIDARFGEINYANVYWSKVVKDLGQMSFLSMGWTMNTTQFIGGFAHDLASNVTHLGELRNKLMGRPSEHQFLTDRILFTLNYAGMVMLANGLRQYIATGLTTGQPQLPEGRDYVFPRIAKDNRGNWIRARPIEFTTEFGIPGVAGGMLAHHAEAAGGYGRGALEMATNKINPYLSNVVHVLQNQNYFGQEISSRLDPAPQQWVDLLNYLVIDPMTPISWKAVTAGGPKQSDWAAGIASFFGLPRASAWTGRSHIENLITQAYYEDHPGERSKEGQEWHNARLALANAVRNKDQTQINATTNDLKRMGASQNVILGVAKHAQTYQQESTQYRFKRLNPIVQRKILSQMSPEERTIYLPLAKKGLQEQLETVSP